MAALIDLGSQLKPINGFPNLSTRIEIEINLLKNKKLDYCPSRNDYLNWIPFEFNLRIGENESYKYPSGFGAQLSLEELKYLFSGTEELFTSIREKTDEVCSGKTRGFKFFSMETYFGIEFRDAHDGLMVVEIWIVMDSLPANREGGYWRGFSYTVLPSEVEIFIAELKEQLEYIIRNTGCTCKGMYGCEC